MPEWTSFGKVLVGIGAAIVVLGLLFMGADRFPGIGGLFGWIGKLPGDISYKRDNFSVYFPIATSLVLSILLSLLFFLLGWLFRR
ncbi:DUF2905 domain-containing protein [Nitrospira moscoviensis]|uniref:DUF2905 domain-containing protein n=1 Tax=Nitrospira moscoviensis TaxID=42253 RepID=A0A0K2G8L0_NITMO|nr:DUF2905 domain-containing protein [Nitrospira moscoviensis]ALA57298.1 hypothetical protein NITMOv2_0863 [Nitrospira moscoviensis]